MVRYYNELTRLEMEQVDKDETVVMIPVGALEQHGNQCPLGHGRDHCRGNSETDQKRWTGRSRIIRCSFSR